MLPTRFRSLHISYTFSSSTTNQNPSKKHQCSTNENLYGRDEKAHPEVAVADERDRQQLEADHPERHVERQVHLRQQERQRVQDPPYERRNTRDRAPQKRMPEIGRASC